MVPKPVEFGAGLSGPGPSDREEEVRRRIKESPSGVMLGTRALLELCDEVRVGMVGWIDADGEARSEEHNAKQRAFSLIWESRWRGLSPLNRRVLLQTRRPASDWQAGLDRGGDGWRTFWRRELRDRRELSMPPFSSLVRAEGAARDIERLYNCLSDGGYECWAADEDGGKSVLWIRTRKLSALRRALVTFFHIERARRGYPSVTVWHE